MENNFSKSLLDPKEARVSDNHLELGVRLPWYRSLPLSVVELKDLTIDGQTVPDAKVRLSINDKVFSLADLANQTAEFWYVLDSARLAVDWPLDVSREHQVALTVNLYPPYIPGLTWVTRGKLAVKAH